MTIKLDKKLGLGNLSCKVCGQRFQTGINCEDIMLYISYYIYIRYARDYC